jgi:putative phosphoribosyl transferase
MFTFPELVIPDDPAGLVVLPHLTGQPAGPRLSYLAWLVHQAGFATALCDLSGGARLAEATASLRDHAGLSEVPLAYLAGGAAAAAALTAVASGDEVGALVLYGGRVDVPIAVLEHIRVPMLLIAPGNDGHALRTMRHALNHLRCHKRLDEIAGAHHLFEEPGALCRVALHARRWLRRHLRSGVPVPLGLVECRAPRDARQFHA